MKTGFLKAISAFLAVIAVLSLCSCDFSFKKAPKIPSMNFTADAQVKYKTYDALTCRLTSVEDGDLIIDVTNPVLLSGFSIVCRDDSCTIKYGSLSYDADTQKYPQLAFGSIVRQAVDSVKENRDYALNDDGNWSVHANVNSSDVYVILDGETGYPISLSVPSEELEITFSNFAETENTK